MTTQRDFLRDCRCTLQILRDAASDQAVMFERMATGERRRALRCLAYGGAVLAAAVGAAITRTVFPSVGLFWVAVMLIIAADKTWAESRDSIAMASKLRADVERHDTMLRTLHPPLPVAPIPPSYRRGPAS